MLIEYAVCAGYAEYAVYAYRQSKEEQQRPGRASEPQRPGLTATKEAAMNNLTDGTGAPAPSPDDLRRALSVIGADHPGWYAWKGVIAGVLYARWLGSSPPRVVRAISPEALAKAIEANEWEWENRWARR